MAHQLANAVRSEPAADDLLSEHFVLSFLPDSFGASQAAVVLSRLESAYQAAVRALDLTADPPRIAVRLWMHPEAVAITDPFLLLEPEPTIYCGYEAEVPGPYLERAVVMALLGVTAGDPCERAPLLFDGVLEHAAQPGRADAALAEMRRDGRPFSLDDALRDPALSPVYPLLAGSFAGFLIGRHGPEAYRKFAPQFNPTDPNRAAEAVYRKPLPVLHLEWLEALRAIRPAPLSLLGFIRLALGHLRAHWPLVAGLLGSVVFTLADPLIRPFLFRSILDRAVPERDMGLLTTLVGALVGLILFQSLATVIKEYLSARLTATVIREMPLRVFRHLQSLSVQYYNNSRVNELNGRLGGELADLEDGLSTVLVQGTSVVLSVVASLVLLVWVEWRLVLFGVVLLALVFVGPALIGPRAEIAKKGRNKAQRSADRLMIEHLTALPLVRAFAAEGGAVSRFQRLVTEHADQTVHYGLLRGLERTTIQMGGALTQVAVFVAGSYLAVRGDLTVGSLYLFIALFGRNVVTAVMEAARLLKPIRSGASSMQFIQELLSEPVVTADLPGAVPFTPPRRSLRVHGVTFSFTGEQVVLRDIHLELPANRTIAIVGPSGSGKTTLLGLLLRLYEPNQGSVRFDDQDVRRFERASYYDGVATVFQDTVMLNASIRENIRLGVPAATQEQIEEAARKAQIHDFISSLPLGYDTEVGQSGARLSGGQRQRIAIARALLRDPAVLLLDEATSALDPGTEAAINAALNGLAGSRTIIHVTHRLQLASTFDYIVVMDRGRVAETGTHQELLAIGGVYARLWKHQQVAAAADAPDTVGPKLELLRSIPLFAGLEESTLIRMANRFAAEEFAPGTDVMQQGDPGDKFYVMVYGSVDVLLRTPAGERRLATLRDGDYFGEIALLQDVPRTATIRARGPSRMLTLGQAEFNSLLHLAPGLRGSIEQVMAERRRQNAAAAKSK